MKHRTILLAFACIVFHFPLSTIHSQELPQNYFRNPLGIDIALSATFGEFRTGHFHSGLDMRTGGAIGQPVYAAADGYVAKVSISPWGGGKILYIKHPNGYISVYMHLSDYAGAIGKAVLREQYAQQKYGIVKLFAHDELPVKKGQLVAHSGNSGSSGGPHLHFEIRRGGLEDLHTHATQYNPLLFGLPYKDSVKPTIRGIKVYPATASSGTDVPADNTVTVDGPFYLGIYATDAAEGSTAKNGVDHIEVYLDGTLFFQYVTREVPTDSSRMVNALLDYTHFARTRQAYLLTRALPGAEGPWIPVRQGDGIFRLKPGSSHHIGIRVYDIKGNVAERTLTVRSSESGIRSYPSASNNSELRSPNSDLIRYDQNFTYILSPFTFHIPPFTLYADDQLSVEGSGHTVTIRPTLHNIPPHQYYTLSIKGSLPGVPTERTVVACTNGGRTSAFPTTHSSSPYQGEGDRPKGGGGVSHTAQVRDWGTFTLMADTTAPVVRPVNFSEGKPLKVTTLRVKISDNLAGIDTYNCHLNGSWILAEFDGKTATLSIDARGKLRAGKNEFSCEVTDGTGNRTIKRWTLTK